MEKGRGRKAIEKLGRKMQRGSVVRHTCKLICLRVSRSHHRDGVSFNPCHCLRLQGADVDLHISSISSDAVNTAASGAIATADSICDTSNTASVHRRVRSNIDPVPDSGTMVSSRNRSYSIFYPRDFANPRTRFRSVELSLSTRKRRDGLRGESLAATPRKCRRFVPGVFSLR